MLVVVLLTGGANYRVEGSADMLRYRLCRQGLADAGRATGGGDEYRHSMGDANLLQQDDQSTTFAGNEILKMNV